MNPNLAPALASFSPNVTGATVKAPNPGSTQASARKSAEEFEAVFLTSMLGTMFEGLKTDPPFGGWSSEKTYLSLLVNEYAKEISRNGGLGIADQITRDLIALQEDARK